MPGSGDQGLQEARLLTRAVENVFRRLIRFLVGRISLVRLVEMIRYIYVEEAERSLRAQAPGKNVPLTRLGLVTGLDTRALVRVRESLELDRDQYRQQFLTELTPESAIVEACAQRTRAPGGKSQRILEYGREDAAFERLVRSTISTRGITIQSIIKRLAATGSVEQDQDRQTLKLRVSHFSPYLSDDEPNIVNAAFSAISNLIATIEHNVGAEADERLFQRQSWTFRLRPQDQAGFRRAMRRFLEDCEQRARREIAPWEGEAYRKEDLTAGVGFYYFEDV
jgi:hypothetical protein